MRQCKFTCDTDARGVYYEPFNYGEYQATVFEAIMTACHERTVSYMTM